MTACNIINYLSNNNPFMRQIHSTASRITWTKAHKKTNKQQWQPLTNRQQKANSDRKYFFLYSSKNLNFTFWLVCFGKWSSNLERAVREIIFDFYFFFINRVGTYSSVVRLNSNPKEVLKYFFTLASGQISKSSWECMHNNHQNQYQTASHYPCTQKKP